MRLGDARGHSHVVRLTLRLSTMAMENPYLLNQPIELQKLSKMVKKVLRGTSSFGQTF